MSQQKTYLYCNYSIMSGVTVTFSTGNTKTTTSGFFNCTTKNTTVDLKFALPVGVTLPEDLRVYYSVYSYNVNQNGVQYNGVGQTSALIPAGTTGTTFAYNIYWDIYCAANNWASGTSSNFTLLNQPLIPTSCSGQPSGCTLTSLGTTVTSPTIRGATNGEILFEFTGATGTSLTLTLNGNTVATGYSVTTGYTYTGLTSGFYTLAVFENFCYAQEVDVYLPDGQFFTGDFIVTEPPTIACAHNPVVLQIETATASANPLPAKGTFTVVSGATINNGDTIKFQITYPQFYTAVFEARNYPDRTSYFLASTLKDSTGVSVGTNTEAEIATSIAEALQNDLVIGRLYYITNEDNKVNLVARQDTPNLNLTPAQVTVSTNAITLAATQYGVGEFDGQLTADYSIYAEIYVNEELQFGDTPVAEDFYRVGEIVLPFQSVGDVNIHRFQLDSVLKNYVETIPISFLFTGFTTIPTYDTNYYCKYGEIFPLIANSTTKRKRFKGKTDYKTVINAALDWEDDNDMSEYLGVECTGLTPTAGDYPITGITFLTNSPKTLYVQRNSKQYLSFMLEKYYASSGRTLSCRGDVYYFNGQSTTGLTFFQITSGNSTNFGGMTMLSVGYDGLGLETLENNGNTKVRRVDFAVYQTDANGTYPLTEVKTYIYEIDEAPTRFGTAFLNKFGTWDIFDWVGEVVGDSDITREEYQIPRQINSNGSSPNSFIANSVYGTSYVKKHTVNSGTIDFETWTWLQELLQTNRIYTYTEKHLNYLVVEGEPDSKKSTNTNEYSIQVTFRETLMENNVSV